MRRLNLPSRYPTSGVGICEAMGMSRTLARRFRTALAATTVGASLALGLAACGGGSGVDESADLVIYSGRSEELVGPLIERFEKQSGLDVSVRYGDSAELAALVGEEGSKSPADLVWFQDAGSLDALSGADLLGSLPADLAGSVPARFKDSDGRWVGTSARARVIAYDTRVLKASQLPGSVFDLTEPEWKGKVGWAPTNASFQAFITAMRAVEGEAKTRTWIDGMVANDAQRLENNIAIRDAIARGELELGLINHYYVAEAKADDPSYPVGVSSPAGDIGAMVNVAGVGLVAGTDDAAAGAQFAEFLLSKTGQEYAVNELKEYSVLGGYPTPTGVTPLKEIQVPKGVDLTKLGDQQGTVELLQDAGVL